MEDKPLPAIPPRSQFLNSPSALSKFTKLRRESLNADRSTVLCVQARQHRNKFIRFVLDEVSQNSEGLLDVGWIERNRDELSWSIEDALDDLGRSIGQGGWLVGIRRARSLSKLHSGGTEGDDSNSDSDVEKDAKVRQLSELASQQLPPTLLPTPKHLLLCLAPVGSYVSLPEEDAGFDIIPSQIRCTFKSGVFVFPEPDQDNTFLYGYDEWSPLLSSSNPLRLVGGTFQFSGVPGPPAFHAALGKALKLTIYQHISLLLEQHLLSDTGLALSFPSLSSISASRQPRNTITPRNRVLSQGATIDPHRRLESSEHRHSFSSESGSERKQSQLKGYSSKPSLFPSSILSFFSKRSLGRTASIGSQVSKLPVAAVRRGSLDLRGSDKNLETEPAHARSSMDSSVFKFPSSTLGGGSTPATSPTPSSLSGRIRRFSFGGSAFVSNANTSNPASPSPLSAMTTVPTSTLHEQHGDSSPAKHFTFTNLVNHLSETKDMFSTSPGVGENVELPELLVRLAERERNLAVGRFRGDERVALKELIGWSTSVNEKEGEESAGADGSHRSWNHSLGSGAGMTGIKGFLKHQSLSALVTVHVPVEEGSGASASTTPLGSTDQEPLDEPSEDDDQVDSSDGEPQHSREGDGDSVNEKTKAIREQQATSSTSKALSGDPSPAANSTSSLPIPLHQNPKKVTQHIKRKARPEKFMPCTNAQPPRWETFLYRKTRMDGGDGSSSGVCLGEMIQGWLEGAEEPCFEGLTLCGNVAQQKLPGDFGGKKNTSLGNELSGDKGSGQRTSSDVKGKEKAKEERDTTLASKTGLCKITRGKHEIRFMHGGMRVTVVVSALDPVKQRKKEGGRSLSSLGLVFPFDRERSSSTTSTTTAQLQSIVRAKTDTDMVMESDIKHRDDYSEDSEDGDEVEMWMSCALCGRDNWAQEKHLMSDGTFLLPFGKYLELLLYSPSFSKIDTTLCDHLKPVSFDDSRFRARSPSSPSAFSPTDPPTSLQRAAISMAISDNDTRRWSAAYSRSSADSLGSLPSPTSPTSGWPFSLGFGRVGGGLVKKSSSLRSPHSSSEVEEQDAAELDDTTPTPSRIVSRSFQHLKEEDSGQRVDDINSRKEAETLPDMRFNIVRHFSNRTHKVSISIDKVDDVFELRVPRVQIIRGMSVLGPHHAQEATSSLLGGVKDEVEDEDEMEKKKLRREIKTWWEGVADHVDMLEGRLATETQESYLNPRKSLPRLPSSDDAYDDFDEVRFSNLRTPKPEGLPSEGSVTGRPAYLSLDGGAESIESEDEESSSAITPKGTPRQTNPHLPPIESNESLGSTASLSSASDASFMSSSRGDVKDPILLLSNLRYTFHRTEQSLYTQLSKTQPESLNEVRRAFHSAAKGTERRLEAWQKKHMGLGLKVVSVEPHRDADGQNETVKKEREREKSGKDRNKFLSLCVTEPEWWDKSCNVVPGGNIIIREDDWGSIIAFTLSTDAYRQELGAMSGVGSRPVSISSESSLPSAVPGSRPGSPPASPSFFSTTGYRLFRSSALSQPDPDQEDVVWHEPEAYSAVISRKEHPKDPTGLLSIREVLRQKAPGSLDPPSLGSILSGSRIATLGKESGRLLSSALGGSLHRDDHRPSVPSMPPSAWAKPDVQISKEAAGGEVVTGDMSTADRILQGLDAATSSKTISRPNSSTSLRSAEPWMPNPFEDAHIRRGKASSIISFESGSTVEPDDSSAAEDTRRLSLASAAANKGSYLPPPPVPIKDILPTPLASPRPSFSTFTSGLTTAMRAMLHNAPDAIRRPQSVASTSKHHGLLSAETAPIDERPHIKYDWTVGKRLKFSCTVYYAKQFDILRKRCGVDDIFLKSLSKSQNWSAEGGKSKSNFWKTADERFIIKTLINAWNVADLQVLLELAPSYFRYLDSTACKATVLAKLVGFYTIEIRNLETGNVQSKADLLVMENLFYNQNIDKTFDLKGIQGRKVKAGTGSSKTLFDGDWMEGQQQTLTLVHPHSKLVLREAIRSDAEFLARSNIMDYSLLLGVDTKSKEIACGLVDTIGSYTFAKTLEYKAKQGLNAGGGKEVTVIPPAEYQERFVSALERYFLACPDKWSKPLDPESKITNDLEALSSIL
ncbi:hypothetical protein L218DRAFT_1082241 [Marasmius fiardii PR-910]|nr:hypothetical protein L218DRAFT_1082241 [Marasmius fiardii PR-910]